VPKLVLKSGYIKAGKAGGYMKYIATRERVEKLEGSGPVTKKQQELIQSLLRDFPDTGELHEYADYTAAPTVGSASALITMALDLNAEEVQTRDGYMKYIATRPRVERQGEHGLFSSAASVSLDAALKELEAHKGNVWTLICSLRREDAQRLGYDRADAWRNLLRSQQVEMANALKISPDKLHWYAAFHDEDTHPHIHVMAWSADPKQGYLTKEGIGELRSRMTNEIFRDELLQLYQEKDQSYKEISQAAREAMRGLLRELERSVCASPELGRQLEALALSLTDVKGKKQYGYLRKPVKEQVDRIVDALAELPPVAECYETWTLCRDALEGYYRDKERERLPLSQQKEFRAVKNMVIREALKLSEQTLGEDMPAAEMKQKADPQTEAETTEKRTEPSQEKTTSTTERRNTEHNTPTPVAASVVRMLHHMSRIFRESAVSDATHKGMQIDRKRRRALQVKRIAMGHKPDDHEEQGQTMK